MSVVGAAKANIIAACLNAAPLFIIGNVMSFLVFDREIKPQFALAGYPSTELRVPRVLIGTSSRTISFLTSRG